MLQVLFNRSRADPTIDPKACSTTTARPPLVYHSNLNRVARFHSSNLSRTGCFQHDSPCLLFPDVASRAPPLGTCDGSASCACSNAPVCERDCTGGACTGTYERVALFGAYANGENIASGGLPRSALTLWLNSSGHCGRILGAYGAVGTGVAGISTGNFADLSGSIPVLVAGGHEVGSWYGEFTSSTAADVGFRANYYHTGGGPRSATVNVDGACTPMSLERGTTGNGTWLASLALTSAQCRRYFFAFEGPSGAAVRLPETGSYGVGGSLATCPDWDAAAPAACGSSGGVAPTVATAAAASPSPSTGTSTVVTVLGADDNGEPGLTYSWSATGPLPVSFSPNGTNAAKRATAAFSGLGSYVLTATVRDAGGLTVTSAVSVTVSPALASVRLSPSTATVAVGASQLFTAESRDQFGARLATQPSFTFTVTGGGTIAPSGLFTAGTAVGGPYTVTASSGGASGAATVSVAERGGAPAAPRITVGAVASPSPVVGSRTTVTVSAEDDGGEPALTYEWSASGPATVRFEVNETNETNEAKATVASFSVSGDYTLTVTVVDTDGNTATSAVSVPVSYVAPPVRDTTPPSVAIIEPREGATASDTPLTVRLQASDDQTLARVIVSMDGRTAATLTAPPWQLVVDVQALPSGPHTLTARAVDTEGNAAEAPPVSFERAPTSGAVGGVGCSASGAEGTRLGLSLLWLLSVSSGRVAGARKARATAKPGGQRRQEPCADAATAPTRRRPARRRPGLTARATPVPKKRGLEPSPTATETAPRAQATRERPPGARGRHRR